MANDEPEFIIVGEKVALGPLRHDLAGAYARWMNQLEVRRGLDYRGIATSKSQDVLRSAAVCRFQSAST